MAKKKAKKKAAKSAKKVAKKTTAKKTTAKKSAKKKATKKTSLVFVDTELKDKSAIQKLMPGHDLVEFDFWVRKPDSRKKERIVSLARLCGQKQNCITAIEQE